MTVSSAKIASKNNADRKNIYEEINEKAVTQATGERCNTLVLGVSIDQSTMP